MSRKQEKRASMRVARRHFIRKHGRASIETIQRCTDGSFRCVFKHRPKAQADFVRVTRRQVEAELERTALRGEGE